MTKSRRAQWTNAVVFALLAAFIFALNRDDGVIGSIVFPAILALGAIVSSPIFKRKSVSHRKALALTGQHDSQESESAVSDSSDSQGSAPGETPNVIIYHRPGCSFCARMKMALREVADRAVWVDIWEDPEAAEFVRSVNNGNETVPTVVIDGKPHTNPPPAQVHQVLSAAPA